MKKIGLQQWVVDLLENDEKVKESNKKVMSDDEFEDDKNKTVDYDSESKSIKSYNTLK